MMDKSLTLDERLTATYVRALQDDCFSYYRPQRPPYVPKGWVEDYAKYQSTSDAQKQVAWRGLLERHSGYINAKAVVTAHNASNKHFLKQMREHFKKMGLLAHADKIRIQLEEFEVLL